MILGIGTDIADIRRFEQSIEKFGERFLHRIFTQHERDYCEARSGKAAYYAKRFAAKEAVAKALATENSGALSWKEVWVENDPSGRPCARLEGKAEERLLVAVPDGFLGKVHLSLSDDYPYAQAFAIVEALKVE